ncbi:MAG: class I SAM-dependent rRNA methyltransferase [Planctomycetes bacterium]|nr:class I SAM-dependent rRNA methyltransferase [Planctomycetota bacterium]
MNARRPSPRPSTRARPVGGPIEYAQGPIADRPLCVDPALPVPAVYLRTPTWHPLIYRKRIDRVEGGARPGDLVAVYLEPDQLLGYGLYNPRSEFAVRIVRWGTELPDAAFWRERFERAVALRRDFLGLDRVTDAYRLVHAEGDGLPGLVVDRFGETLSAEVFSLGMFQRCRPILDGLAALCGTRHTVVQAGPNTVAQEGFACPPVVSDGAPPRVTIHEFQTRFRVRFEGGHKTGFFCDQRDNRKRLAGFCGGKSVLDLCCYSGGFAIQAKRLGGATEVIGVDLDEEPLQLARENADLNQVRVRFVQADIFPFMRDMLRGGRQFDVVVLDPPKLIRSRAEIDEGTRAHFDMNRLAMQLVKPGGLMLSCTCAGLLPESEFVRLLSAAARQAGPPDPRTAGDERPRHAPRAMQILEKTGAAPDHPVDAMCPEGEYLNAVWMRLV